MSKKNLKNLRLKSLLQLFYDINNKKINILTASTNFLKTKKS
jgi:hypothetical protein